MTGILQRALSELSAGPFIYSMCIYRVDTLFSIVLRRQRTGTESYFVMSSHSLLTFPSLSLTHFFDFDKRLYPSRFGHFSFGQPVRPSIGTVDSVKFDIAASVLKAN